MKKSEAIRMIGSTATELAAAVGVTSSAVSQWPDDLTQNQIDRVVGAAVRLGRLRVHQDPEEAEPVLSAAEKAGLAQAESLRRRIDSSK